MKVHGLFRKWKIWLLLLCLVFAIIAIHPNPWNSGVAIRSVAKDSAASLAGIENPKPILSPMSREVITALNNVPIKDMHDYNRFLSSLVANATITVKTGKDIYRLTVRPLYNVTVLNETEMQEYVEGYFNETLNTTVNVTRQRLVNKTRSTVIGIEDIGLKVYNAPTTNIRKGLDLQGGTRVLLKPEEEINASDVDVLIENMKERLNVYGLSDIVVKSTSDLSGETFILVEIAGASDQEVRELISKQGKFEAKINNQTIFLGGTDIKRVCRTAECSYIERCNSISSGGYACKFN